MKLNINYVLLFSLLVYLKFNDNKNNDPLKLGSYVVIAYLIYRLLKGKNVEGWPADQQLSDGSILPGGLSCEDSANILYIGSPSPSPGPDDNIMKHVGPSPSIPPSSWLYLNPGCTGSGKGRARIEWVSENLNRESIKTIALLNKPNNFHAPTGSDQNVGMLLCSEEQNDQCIDTSSQATPDTSGPPLVPPLFHCMDGTGDNTIDTQDLLHCFTNGSSCGHTEDCALYHSFHFNNVVRDQSNHASPGDHCSHLLYADAVENPTVDPPSGSVIQKIVLKYANHYNTDITNSEDLESTVISSGILAGEGEGNDPIFSNESSPDKILCAQFNALYDSDCLTLEDMGHSQLFENIHEACSNIDSPDNYDITEDWLNTMDRYCSIGDISAAPYKGIPIHLLNKDLGYPGYLKMSESGIIGSDPDYNTEISINSDKIRGPCASPYIGNYTLSCNNSINREYAPLEILDSCSKTTVSEGTDPCSSNPCSSPMICSHSPGEENGYICSLPGGDQGGGGQDGGGQGGVRGCTDSNATNFNSEAITDDGSCEYDNPCSPNPCRAGRETCHASPRSSPPYRCKIMNCREIANIFTCMDHEDCKWADNKCEDTRDRDIGDILLAVLGVAFLLFIVVWVGWAILSTSQETQGQSADGLGTTTNPAYIEPISGPE